MISQAKSHYTPLQKVLLLNLLNHGATLQVLYLLVFVRMPKIEDIAVTKQNDKKCTLELPALGFTKPKIVWL